MTITLDEKVYYGLYRTVKKGKISKFIEDLIKPHVLGSHSSLDEGYKAMALDEKREYEAYEWIEALTKDIFNEKR